MESARVLRVASPAVWLAASHEFCAVPHCAREEANKSGAVANADTDADLDAAFGAALWPLRDAAATAAVSECEATDARPIELLGHAAPVSAASFSPDGRVLVTCAEDGLVFWRVADARAAHSAGRRCCGRSVARRLGPVLRCRFSPDGALLALAVESRVAVVDASSGAALSVLAGHEAAVRDLCFARFGNALHLATVSEDRTFVLWNLAAGAVSFQSALVGTSPLCAVAFDETSARLAVAAADGSLRIFDAAHPSAACIHALSLKAVLRRVAPPAAAAAATGAAGVPAAPRVIRARGRAASLRLATALQDMEDEALARLEAEEAARRAGEGGDDDVDVAVTTLALAFLPPTQKQLLRPPLPRRDVEAKSREEGFEGSALPPLLAVTSAGLAIVSSALLEVSRAERFGEARGDMESIGLCGCAAVAECAEAKGAAPALVLGEAFQRLVHCVSLRVEPEAADLGAVVPPRLHWRLKSGIDDASEATEAPTLRADSPLQRWRFAENKATPSKVRGRPTNSLDKPILFHKSVRSSGYGPAPLARSRRAPSGPATASTAPAARGDGGGKEARLRVRAELNGRAMQLDEAETPRHALHAKAITRLVFAGDGSRLLTCSLDGTAQLMRLPHTRHQRANVTAAALSGHDGPLRDCAVSATGRFLSAASKTAGAEPRLLLTCAADRTARVWCEGMANPLMTIRTARSSGAESETNPAFAGEVTAGSFFFRDRFIAAACEGELLLFRFALQPPESPLQGARWTARYAAAFVGRHDDAQSVTAMGCANAGDAPLVLTATSNRALHVWDLNAARVALSLPDAHARPIHCISAASAESAHWGWLTAAVDGSVRLWDARVGATVRRFQGHVNRQQPVRAALSSCGTLVATGSEDKSVYLFDVRSGAQVQRLAGFADVVSDVAFHPTAPSLAAATYDGRVRLFREAAA